MGTRTDVFRLAETLENKRKKFGFNTFTVIGDPYLDMGIYTLQHQLNAAAFRSEFDRIRQQIPYNLLQTLEIARYRTRMGIQDRLDPDPPGVGSHDKGLDSRVNNRSWLHRSHVEAKFPHRNAGDIQKVLDKLCLRPHIAIDDLQRLFRSFGREIS